MSRPISDLDDVRDSMAALGKIRSKEIEIDMVIGPIEVGFMLAIVVYLTSGQKLWSMN